MPEATQYGKIRNGRLRLLVVDDEPDIALSFMYGLEMHGFSVDAFTDPEEALELYKPNTYDLLLIDINMPKLDGFKLFEKIRESDPHASACFITAFETYFEAFKKIFPEMEIDCFIRKPISITDLAKYIQLRTMVSPANLV